MSDIECPYCSQEQEINHDGGYGYEENTTYEQCCFNCDKSFAYTTSIHFYYSAEKAPCMNGEPHNFKPTCTTPKWWAKMRCDYCDEERELTEDEREKHDIPPIPGGF